MIISIDTEDKLDKIQQPFIIKTLNKLGIEGNFLNLLKNIYEKLTDNFILNGEGVGAFLPMIRNKTKMSALATSTQQCIEILTRASSQEKEIKGIKFGKEETKLSLFADDMIL